MTLAIILVALFSAMAGYIVGVQVAGGMIGKVVGKTLIELGAIPEAKR